MQHARRAELQQTDGQPAGLEVHRDGVFHEVQRGETLGGIVDVYSSSMGLDIGGSAEWRKYNADALKHGLKPGELLRVPWLDARMDSSAFTKNHTLHTSYLATHLLHGTMRGDTFASVARQYRATEGLHLSSGQLRAANPRVTPNGNGVIKPGTDLRIPGITFAAPAVTNRSLIQLEGVDLLTLTSRIRHENGDVETVDTMQYVGDGAHAEQLAGGTARDAIALAQARLETQDPISRTYAVIQAKSGAHWIVPMVGREAGTGDDSTTTLSLAMRANEREVVAVVQRSADGIVTARRFDR